MKRINIISGLILLLAANLFGQTSQRMQGLIWFLDPDSQTNLVVIRDGNRSLPCPPQYTNLLSNTNLFTPAEQKLLQEVMLKYKNITTNSGPPGSILAGLHKDTNNCWVALFRYTNSDARDEITFDQMVTARHLDNANDGYEVNLSPESRWLGLGFRGLKHGMSDGLCVQFYGDGHCRSWMQFSNNMAVGKWLEWSRLDNGLSLEVEFKAPYDFQKHVIFSRMKNINILNPH